LGEDLEGVMEHVRRIERGNAGVSFPATHQS
jgi:hypothetical protein